MWFLGFRVENWGSLPSEVERLVFMEKRFLTKTIARG